MLKNGINSSQRFHAEYMLSKYLFWLSFCFPFPTLYFFDRKVVLNYVLETSENFTLKIYDFHSMEKDFSYAVSHSTYKSLF